MSARLLLTLLLATASPWTLRAEPHGHEEHGHNDHHEEHAAEGHAHEGHEQETGGVSFDPEHGLELSEEVLHALSLKTGHAERRDFTGRLERPAQVLSAQPPLRAQLRLVPSEAAGFGQARLENARILKVDTSAVAATGLVDVVVELDATESASVGRFLPVAWHLTVEHALVVPRSAVLDTPAGAAVYVVAGDAYRRVPVKLGWQTRDEVQVLEGLPDDATLVLSPVEPLWLTELRLTKGGGHSH